MKSKQVQEIANNSSVQYAIDSIIQGDMKITYGQAVRKIFNALEDAGYTITIERKLPCASA